MVTMDVLGENLLALVLVWGWAYVGGTPWNALLPGRLGFGGTILCGLAFWAAAVHVIPLPHGLDLFIVLALAGFVPVMWKTLKHCRAIDADPGSPPSPISSRWQLLILLVGCASYGSMLVTQYVPPGMDASMHTTNARLIAGGGGVPRTFAPFAAELDFPAINLGLPALAAVAIRCGCQATSAFLAAEHLALSAFILATYLLLRLWVRPVSAALLAVFAAWSSRGAQETFPWGGVPTLASVALGVFAVRILVDVMRRPSYRAGVPLGIVVAAMPLVHAIGAAVWLYTVAPVALAVAWLGRGQHSGSCQLRPGKECPAYQMLGIAAGLAVAILGVYVAFARNGADEEEQAMWRVTQLDYEAKYVPLGEGWHMVLGVPSYIKTSAGSLCIWPGALAAGVLLVQRRWRALAAITTIFGLLCLVVANSRVHWLPMSFLLYPERAYYFATPLAVVAMALAWRYLHPRLRSAPGLSCALVVFLVAAGLLRHVQMFQSYALKPTITRDEWEALQWAARELDPSSTLVKARYNTAASYLPSAAGIATTGWHMHHFMFTELHGFYRSRTPTHLLNRPGSAQDHSTFGRIVFRNDDVVIRSLD